MIKIEKTEVFGFEAAIRGLRNPMNSWDKSDSGECYANCDKCPYLDESRLNHGVFIGDNDMALAKKLIKAGSDHRKFMRMIHVQADVLAPIYFWKEYDTYKVGTVANSCSTMHTIHKKEFTLDDFSHEHLDLEELDIFETVLFALNWNRKKYIKEKNKDYWWRIIQLLPSSYNQLRTIDLNYEVLFNIYHQRKNHKLDEWSGEKGFCKWIETLPYMRDFLGLEEE